MFNTVIWIAEDDEEDYNFLEIAIKEHLPLSAINWYRDGEKFVEEITNDSNKEIPHLVILDYNMPKLTGLQTMKILRQDDRFNDVPIVFYSSGTFRHYISEIMEEGANGYYEKGITFQQIRENVKHMLNHMKIARPPATEE